MGTHRRRGILSVVVSGLVAVVAGCTGSGPSTSTSARPGQTGTSFLVLVSKQPGGTVTSSDGRINCGTGGNVCGPVSYAWAETVTLTATPDAGNMFGTWAGDCLGGNPVCTLDTKTHGADKFVAAVFDASGLAQHPNFTDPALHGLEFEWWKAEQAGNPLKPTKAFECTACHGATYAGMGIAPSCNACHARNGHPDWLNDCTFCHATPPGNLPATFESRRDQNGVPLHPGVSSDVTTCMGCHPDTVDANGSIIAANGKHMNGMIDGGGHEAGYNDPSIHGRDFFAAIADKPSAPFCTGCHGASYDTVMPLVNRSCNGCHAASPSLTPPGGGWSGTEWKSNCTFCHGTRTIAYASPADLNEAAPPDALSQRLTGAAAPDRTGAHTIHLVGSDVAGPFRCGVCHQVPTTLSHISGREARAAVAIDAPGGTGPDATAYDPTSATCGTYCHDPQIVGKRSPAWSATGLQCDGCHGLPPATAAHTYASTDLRECAGCHPDTIKADGTIDVAGGKHVNGAVDRVGGHDAGFELPANHGPLYLDYAAGVPGAMNCTTCHGTSLTYCTNCHSSAASGGWQGWRTNCTFCHGTKTPAFTAAELNLAAPPDAISQRLTGIEVPDRSGQHSLHLNNGGFVPAPHFPCDSCHDLGVASHISVERRATVALDRTKAFPALPAADLAKLPQPLGTYDPIAGTCTAYCHGATMQGGVNTLMKWTSDFDFATPIFDCTDCHGSPPLTGRTVVGHTYPTPPTNTRYCGTLGCSNHLYHRNAAQPNGWDSCSNCHYGSAQGTFYAGLHVSGRPDVVFTPPGTPGYKSFTATWDPVARTCTTSCHTNSGPTTAQPW